MLSRMRSRSDFRRLLPEVYAFVVIRSTRAGLVRELLRFIRRLRKLGGIGWGECEKALRDGGNLNLEFVPTVPELPVTHQQPLPPVLLAVVGVEDFDLTLQRGCQLDRIQRHQV